MERVPFVLLYLFYLSQKSILRERSRQRLSEKVPIVNEVKLSIHR